MARSKWQQIESQLAQIEAWARDGLTEAQMQKNLGVGKTAFEAYKKAHPELKQALERGRKPFIDDIRSALVKRALGFEYEETKTYIKQEDGKAVRYQEITKKVHPPNVAACFILLKNLDRDGNSGHGWSDDPARLDLKRELQDFQKELAAKNIW